MGGGGWRRGGVGVVLHKTSVEIEDYSEGLDCILNCHSNALGLDSVSLITSAIAYNLPVFDFEI